MHSPVPTRDCRSSLSHALFLAGGLLLGVPQVDAQAPQPVRGVVIRHHSGGTITSLCGADFSPYYGNGATLAACTTTGVTAAAFVENSAGLARGRTMLIGDNLPGAEEFADSWSAVSETVWRDRLTVTGGNAVSVDFTLHWTGVVAAQIDNPDRIPASADATAAWGFEAYSSSFGSLVPAYRRVVSATAQFGGPQSESRVINDMETFRVPLVGTTGMLLPYIDIIHDLHTRVGIAGGSYGIGRQFDARAVADMSNTSRITSIVFRDANGNDVSNTTTHSFANGTRVSVSAVPEPGTLALLGAGLLGLIAVARRRRTT